MSTLHELVRYCTQERHQGAILLTGEWGCGKTYLIEKKLSEALSETHCVVHVSLFGMDSIDALKDAVRKQWLYVCTPFLGKMNQNKEKMTKDKGFIAAITSALSSLGPAGSFASAMVATNPLDYIPLESEVEVFHEGKLKKKKVVLVFDDLERCKLDMVKAVGNINDYCENKGFKTIIIANEMVFLASPKVNQQIYRVVKEKAISRTVLYIPDYQEIIHHLLAQGDSPSDAYAEFLAENERLICDVFGAEPIKRRDGLGKCHNIRSLICALNEFYQIYEILVENQIPDMEQYLYSFITAMMISKCGIYKNGDICFEPSVEEIKQLYPGFSPDKMPACIRQWIEYGVWERDEITDAVCSMGQRAEKGERMNR